MYELIKLTENNYYIESPAKIGLIVADNEAVIIDSGNDKDAGKKIKKILDANGWSLKSIYNTHSHADHIGGNQYLQNQTGCEVFAKGIEQGFTCYPVLEPSFLYGGNPPRELRHKFMMAQPSRAKSLDEAKLPEGLEVVPLPGHSFDMVGFKTADSVFYIADSLSSEATLNKYGIGFLTDVEAYLETLEMLKNAEAQMFVPAHAEATQDIAPLAQLNIDKVMQVGEVIAELCAEPKTFEEILKNIFEHYSLTMTFEQHALIGSTVKSYLTWLKNSGKVAAEIDNNCMLWKKI